MSKSKTRMPYRISCNDVQREDAKLSPDLASRLFCYVPLHKIWYGTKNRTLTDHLSDKMFIYLDYLFSTKRFLNLKNPRRFTEKIQWLKIYGNLEQYTEYVDKLEVRKFITRRLGKEYLIPLIGVWDKFEDIPFEELPEKFVIKATHGSGYNYLCKDKSSLDKKYLRKLLTKWIGENYYDVNREAQYKLCKPKIIGEVYLEDESGALKDYKFSCFHGEPCMIEVMSDRYTDPTLDLYDIKWNKMPFSEAGYKSSTKRIVKPKNFEYMLYIVEKLCKDFPFVRVDLYSVNGKIYFGELTFTPANGLDMFCPDQADYDIGGLLDLAAYGKK